MKRALSMIAPVILCAVLSLGFSRPTQVNKAASVTYSFDDSESFPTNYLRIKINGTTVVEETDDAWGEVNPAGGATVTFEASVSPSWIMTVYITDETTHDEIYYSDNETSMSTSWTAVDGHNYHISFNGH
jgi:hypothetical protein